MDSEELQTALRAMERLGRTRATIDHYIAEKHSEERDDLNCQCEPCRRTREDYVAADEDIQRWESERE